MAGIATDTKTGIVQLHRLALRNFKGIESFQLDADGRDVRVYGDNGTGKTTIADAFTWLLFDKSSDNKKGFEIKTLGLDGQPIHFLEHEVDALLHVDGKELSLRKMYQEKWTRPRSTAEQVFDGHTNRFWINSVPVQLGQYKQKVTELCDEQIFRLLTDPTYFNDKEAFPWEKRRRLLLEVCGDVCDSDVIAAKPSLSELAEILTQRSLEDHRKVLNARRKEVNAEIEKIPSRVDEAKRFVVAVPMTENAIAAELVELQAKRSAFQEDLTRIETGGQSAELRRRMSEVETKILDLKNAETAKLAEKLKEERKQLVAMEERAQEPRRTVNRLNGEIQDAEARLARHAANLNDCLMRHKQVDGEVYTSGAIAESCPSCGQSLPTDQVDAAKQKHLEAFNLSRSQRLEKILAEGKAARTAHNDTASHIEDLRKQLAAAEQDLSVLTTQIETEKARLQQGAGVDKPPTPNPEIDSLNETIKELQAEIERLNAGTSTERARIQNETATIDQRVQDLNGFRAQLTQIEQAKKRVTDLGDSERVLAAELGKIDKELHLSDEFIRTKVRLLESKINSKFRIVGFKLFEEQINGALNETCICTVNGVPYDGALNHGSRVNAGLDVIRTLQSHYGFYPPVIIDGAESTTSYIPMECQLIKLFVSEQDKTLRVETAIA